MNSDKMKSFFVFFLKIKTGEERKLVRIPEGGRFAGVNGDDCAARIERGNETKEERKRAECFL